MINPKDINDPEDLLEALILEETDRIIEESEDAEKLGLEFHTDGYVYNRIRATAYDHVYDQMQIVEKNIRPALIALLDDMIRFGYFGFLEADNIYDYIASKNNPDLDIPDSEASDIAFVVTYLLPAMRSIGISRKTVLNNFRKTRIAIPYLRVILGKHIDEIQNLALDYSGVLTDDELETKKAEIFTRMDAQLVEILEELIKEIQLNKRTGGMSALEFGNKLRKLRDGTAEKEKEPKVTGTLYEDGTNFVLTFVGTRREIRRVQQQLGSVAEITKGSMSELMQKIGDYILNKGDHKN